MYCISEDVGFLQNFEIAQVLDNLLTTHEGVLICEGAFASQEVVQVLPIG